MRRTPLCLSTTRVPAPMFSRRGLSRVENDKPHASFRPFGSSRHGGAHVKTVPDGHVISSWPKSEELSAWIFWDTGEFENGARSYIFITLKRLREYGRPKLPKALKLSIPITGLFA
jgi:hypothetical protein